MNKYKQTSLILFLFLLIILTSKQVFAIEISPKLITINEEEILSGKATYEITINSVEHSGSIIFDELNPLKINTLENIQTLELYITSEDYEYPDFVGGITFDPKTHTNPTIFLQEVGTLRVKLNDIRFDDVIRITCENNYENTRIFVVDETKVFETNKAPISTCEVRATYSEGIKQKNANISKGKLTEINFEINEKQNNNSILFIGIILFSLVVMTTLYFKKNKTSNYDPFKFLSAKKRRVIFFLKDHDYVNQSKIVYECKIPKTTLVRILNKLESKNIIEIEKIGKSKRIKLKKEFKELK